MRLKNVIYLCMLRAVRDLWSNLELEIDKTYVNVGSSSDLISIFTQMS